MMIMVLPEWLHRTLRIPYLLKVTKTGSGRPIVFLHGLASFKEIWSPVTEVLSRDYCCISLDLLGHGRSPKPTHMQYTPHDHLRSIRWTLFWHGVWRRPIVVGHSMGALLATHWSVVYPREVARLVLVAMPIYAARTAASGKKRLEGLVDVGYLMFYRALRTTPRRWAIRSAKALMRRSPSLVGQASLDESTWYPVVSSLQNTVELQTASADIAALDERLPITVLYGTLDQLVLASNLKKAFLGRPHTRIMRVLVPHELTPRYCRAIVRAIKTKEDPWYTTQKMKTSVQ